MKYIGKKVLFFERNKRLGKKALEALREERKANGIGGRTPLKQNIITESDWKDYYGSNKHLNEDVEKMGPDTFYREILHLCKTKGECSYMEAKEQFDREVLLTDDYYNGIIQIRLGGNAIKNFK